MAKGGRPRKGDEVEETTQVRCTLPMAAMLSDLILVLPLSTAQLLQRVALANLTELHETHKAQIEKVKAARAAAEEAQRRAIEEAAQVESRITQKPTRKPKSES